MNLKDCMPHRKAMFPWLSDLPNLSPDSFPWNEWEGDNSWLGQGENDIIELPEGWIALGWCDGGKLAVRPKSDQIAVKFSDGDREFWQHILV